MENGIIKDGHIADEQGMITFKVDRWRGCKCIGWGGRRS